MKKWIFTFALILSFNALADVPSCGENCTYTLVQNNDDNDNPTYTLKVMPVDPSKPASVQEYEATCDGGCHTNAPWQANSSITKLDIAEGITSVGNHAFTYTRSIKEIILPEGLQTIGNAAFHRTGITSIDLPSSLTEIGDNAFITKSLAQVNGTLENLTSMGVRCFADTALTDFVVPPYLKNLPDDSFNGKDNWTGYISPNFTNLYCPEALAAQCAAAIAYRGDAAQVTSYDYKGGVYVIKDEDGNETYYLSGDNMKNGQMCEGTLSECKKEALINRGVCSGSDCDALVAADNGGYLLKVGSKTYQNINALLKGDYDRRRIYTIEEAIFVAGDKNRVSITYR